MCIDSLIISVSLIIGDQIDLSVCMYVHRLVDCHVPTQGEVLAYAHVYIYILRHLSVMEHLPAVMSWCSTSNQLLIKFTLLCVTDDKL